MQLCTNKQLVSAKAISSAAHNSLGVFLLFPVNWLVCMFSFVSNKEICFIQLAGFAKLEKLPSERLEGT